MDRSNCSTFRCRFLVCCTDDEDYQAEFSGEGARKGGETMKRQRDRCSFLCGHSSPYFYRHCVSRFPRLIGKVCQGSISGFRLPLVDPEESGTRAGKTSAPLPPSRLPPPPAPLKARFNQSDGVNTWRVLLNASTRRSRFFARPSDSRHRERERERGRSGNSLLAKWARPTLVGFLKGERGTLSPARGVSRAYREGGGEKGLRCISLCRRSHHKEWR